MTLFLVEKICVSLKNVDKNHTDIVNSLTNEVKILQEKNQELKEANFMFAEQIRKAESDTRAIVDKEIFQFRDKVGLN